MRGKGRHRHFMGNFFPCMHKVLFIPSLQLAKTPMSTAFHFLQTGMCVRWKAPLIHGTGTVTSCCCSSSCCENHQDYKLKNDTDPKCTFSFFFFLLPFKSLSWSEVFSPEVAGCHPGKCHENTLEGKEKVVLVQELNYSKIQNVRLRRAENGRKISLWKQSRKRWK